MIKLQISEKHVQVGEADRGRFIELAGAVTRYGNRQCYSEGCRYVTFEMAKTFFSRSSAKRMAELFAVIALAKWLKSLADEPEGMRPSALGRYQIAPTADGMREEAGNRYSRTRYKISDEACRAFLERNKEWALRNFGSNFDLQSRWEDCPAYELKAVLPAPEIYRLWRSGVVASNLDDYIREHVEVLWKIGNALWHYGPGGTRWNDFAMAVQGISKLTVDNKDFDVRLTWARYHNEYGRSVHDLGLWLDGAMGLRLFHRGAHVMTIGFNPFNDGEVGIVQVQLRKKKGNRFLYQLGTGLLDFVVDMFAKAFGEDKVHIVDGESAVFAIRKSYGNEPCSVDEEAGARIAGLYDRPLERFERSAGFSRETHWRKYYRLKPRKAALQEAS